jgi:hypothetical protein
VKKIKIKDLLGKQFKKDNFLRYDVIIRYLFIEQYYYEKKPNDFNDDLYMRLAKARGKSGKRDSFIEMINSFEKNGFLDKYPLVIKPNFCMCGGGHRLACCFWFDIDEVPIHIHKSSNNKVLFTKKWLLSKGFEDVMPMLDEVKEFLFTKWQIQ